MILTDRWLRANAAEIGYNPEFVNPASVDVCLGGHIIEYDANGQMQEFTLAPGETFWFRPGFFYLAHTEEYTRIPEDACAQLILKSSSGRKGLDHAHSGWGDPGFHGQWTFEFVAHRPVQFERGQRIAQLVFMQCAEPPEQSYLATGRYNGQVGATEARLEVSPT